MQRSVNKSQKKKTWRPKYQIVLIFSTTCTSCPVRQRTGALHFYTYLHCISPFPPISHSVSNESFHCTSIYTVLTYPTIVPTPTSVSWATPATDVKSSGAEEPAAIKVAPATSSDRWSFSDMISRDGTKKSSQTIASAERETKKSQSVKNFTVVAGNIPCQKIAIRI